MEKDQLSSPVNAIRHKDNKNDKQVPSFELSAFEGVLPPGDFFKNVFIPNWLNQPKELPAILSLNGTGILTHQNIAALIAHPGIGKSSICESIIAAYINPECNSLGFEIGPECKGVIYIDNERTDTDVWNSFYRVCKRAGIKENESINNVIIAGLRAIPRLKQRIAAIEYLLETYECSILLLDGAGDLVNDTNNLEEAKEFTIWAREITLRFSIPLFVTIHPNPGTEKPRGHLGSEICREAESVLLAKSFDNNIRLLTTDFEHGKNRNNPKLTAGYKWSDESHMFVSADIDCITDDPKAKKQYAIKQHSIKDASEIIPPPEALQHNVLIKRIMQKLSCSEPTAKRRLTDWLGWDIIKKHDDGFYRYKI